MRPVELRFDEAEGLAAALALRVAAALRAQLAARPEALLLLSGGSTPARLWAALRVQPLDWARVWLCMSDEREVPIDHPRSNLGALRRAAAGSPMAAARSLPLAEGAGVLGALPWPAALSLLGMGEDGHTASLFPGADRLAEALDPRAPPACLRLRAPGAPEPRLSLNLSALINAEHVILHIEGLPKQRALQAALAPGGGAPVAAVLAACPRPAEVYTCP